MVQGLLATCTLQGVDPYAYLVGVRQRVERHPVSCAVELTLRGVADAVRGRPVALRPRPARKLAASDRSTPVGFARLTDVTAPLDCGNAYVPV